MSEEKTTPDHLAAVRELLAKHKLVEDLVHRQDMPRHQLVENLVHKQHEAALRARLSGFKLPRHVAVVETLPRNSMGKVQKNLLRERFRDVFQAG